MRAPFLQTGGDTMFEMLYQANFSYDSSLPVYDIDPPYWPYTLDYSINHDCMIEPCPSNSYPGKNCCHYFCSCYFEIILNILKKKSFSF